MDQPEGSQLLPKLPIIESEKTVLAFSTERRGNRNKKENKMKTKTERLFTY